MDSYLDNFGLIFRIKYFSFFRTSKGLSINYVVRYEGMRFTLFSALAEILFLVNRVKHQKLYGVQLGLDTSTG